MPKKDEDLVLNTSGEIRIDYDTLCPIGGVVIVRPEDLPSAFDQCGGLVNKSCMALVTASGVSGGLVDYTVVLVRPDEKDRALKLHPAIVRFNGDSPASSGCLRHHADFLGRTTYLSSGGWADFNANRSGTYTPPASGFPLATSGSIADLCTPLLHEAHRCVREKLPGWTLSG